MRIALTDAFLRKLARFLRIHKDIDREKIIDRVFDDLRLNINSPNLHTHKLHGKLNGLYACSVTYRYRLVFELRNDMIFPQSIGSHDDVY